MAKNYKNQDNKYTAVWLSHSSMSDFLKCPRLYYLRNIWKNERGNKINIVSPALSLGSAVHQTIEPLANLKADERLEKFKTPENLLAQEGLNPEIINIFEKNWKKFSGKMGGFTDSETESNYKLEGRRMIETVMQNPGPIGRKTVKYYTGDFIPNIYLSEKENIILCGLVDWVEYLEETDSLRVIDFKTGKNDENEESMQLPIYKILVESLQKRKVTSAAYWYLERDKFPKSVELNDEDIEELKNKMLEIGLEIKKRKSGENIEENFKCKYDGDCRACRDFELIRNYKDNTDKVEYLGQGEYKQDLYFIKK